MAADDYEGKNGARRFSTKKCPFCFTYLALHVNRCTVCKRKIGEVDKLGFASKPIDWSGYAIAIVSIIAFVVFMWWSFFSE